MEFGLWVGEVRESYNKRVMNGWMHAWIDYVCTYVYTRYTELHIWMDECSAVQWMEGWMLRWRVGVMYVESFLQFSSICG